VVGEYLFPSLNEGRRNGLCTNVHEAPSIESVLVKVNISAVNCIKNILCPRNEKPYDGGSLFGNSAKDPLGGYTLEDYSAAAADKASEPVHFRTGVIERRNAEENVIAALAVVLLLSLAGAEESLVRVKDSLWETGSTGGEVDCRIIVFFARNCGGNG
jgi:hypothetical protein